MTNRPSASQAARTSGAARSSGAAPDIADLPQRRASIKDGDLANAMELGDFMEELGVVMRLPKRESGAAAVPVPVPVQAQAMQAAQAVGSLARRRPVLPMLAAATVIGFVGWQFRPAPVASVPTQVVGTWETSDPRYPGRQLVLGEHSVLVLLMAKPEGPAEVVHRVTAKQVQDTLAVVLAYGASTPVAELALAYVDKPTEQLVLRNTAGVVWTRAGSTRAPAPAARQVSLGTGATDGARP